MMDPDEARRLRNERKWSQEDVAFASRAVGMQISSAMVAKAESGLSMNTSGQVLVAYSLVFGVPIESLLVPEVRELFEMAATG